MNNIPDQKYELVPTTQEEQQAFMNDLNNLLTVHNVYYEPMPVFLQKELGGTHEVAVQVKLMKKVQLVPSPISPLSTSPDESPETPEESLEA